MTPNLAEQLILGDNVSSLIHHYEQALQNQPDSPEFCAYLGLSYLLSDDEDTAQLTWFNGLMQCSESLSEHWLQALLFNLLAEALNQEKAQYLKNSWLIRQHIRELAPNQIENLLYLLRLDIQLKEFHTDSLREWGIIELLNSSHESIDSSLVEDTLKDVLRFASVNSVEFAEACRLDFTSLSIWADLLISSAREIVLKQKLSNFAAMLMELCLKHIPDNLEALSYLPHFYIDGKRYSKAVESASAYYRLCATNSSLEIRFHSHCLLFKSFLSAGQWNDIIALESQHKTILKNLYQEQPSNLSLSAIKNLITYAGHLPYLQDNLAENRWFQNQASKLAIKNLRENASESFQPISLTVKSERKRIRIGYIASTLREHSVGWLARWLFQNHDRNAFEISVYLVFQRPEDTFFANWFAPYVDQYRFLGDDIALAADTIRNDQLDILIDLDSITLDFTSLVMALKPAPIQATWLGYDASGVESIDYFIADPYVLSENAQQYYQEKIWRLPQTYIAVNGFEIGVPTLRRSDLEIPVDAVVYFSSQMSCKRHPHMLRLQLEILREVPNSFFLIKGLADQSVLQEYIFSLAEEIGVSAKQLKFLDWMPNELTHRANLQIADIVLDTYPYNGATTTLETLWIGIPIVTRVGQQFAARNSYAFMTNIGVTEGIAWTDKEYVEWGVRLGRDEKLRQEISCKLRKSRHTSPLWNVKKFTHEMENAYREMLLIYTSK